MSLRKPLILIAFFIAILNSLSADIIYFNDGRKIEGIVVSKDDKKIKIKTKYGTKEFLLSEIKNIEKKQTLDQIYKEKLKTLNKEDVEEVLKFVDWCKQNKLESKSKIHLKEILKLDPNNSKARELLGYVKHEGKWYTKKEYKELLKQLEIEENIKKGLVNYKGQWLPKEDVKNLKAGLIKYKDKWVTKQEKERLELNLVNYEGQWVPAEDLENIKKGLFKVNGKWVTKTKADIAHSDLEDPWELKSDHVLLRTNKNYDYGQQMLAESEYAYRQIKDIVKIEPNLNSSLLNLFIVSSLEEYNLVGNSIGDEKSSSYACFYVEDTEEGDEFVSVTYSFGDKDSDIRFTKGLVRHTIIEQYLKRIDEKEEIPLWFIKGQAEKLERFFHPQYISWSVKQMIKIGGMIKLNQYFDAFSYTEQEIFQAGLLCAYLDSKSVSEKAKTAYKNALDAIKSGKKIMSAFSSLEKQLIKEEKSIRAYMDKH